MSEVPGAQENLTDEQIREEILKWIGSHPRWSEYEFEGIRYNTKEDLEGLIKKVINSQDRERALRFTILYLKYPLTENSGIGSTRIDGPKTILEMVDGFNSANFEPYRVMLEEQLKGIKIPINSFNRFLSKLDGLEHKTAFFLDNPAIENEYPIIRIHITLVELIRFIYLDDELPFVEKDGIFYPNFRYPSQLMDVAANSYLKLQLETILENGLKIDMELGFWKFLQLVLAPVTNNFRVPIDLSIIQKQIDLKNR